MAKKKAMSDTATRIFNGKRYKLSGPKFFKSEAKRRKAGLSKNYFVRIVLTRGKPSLHGQAYRVYIRRRK